MYMDTYIGWIQQLKQAFNFQVMIMSVDYRLAPEYRYPSPVEDVVRAYEHLILHLCVAPPKIITIGDSAGAALILETLFITHDPSMFEIVTDDGDDTYSGGRPLISELPRPAGTVLVSPLVTDETSAPSWQDNLKHDYISHHTAKVIKRDYFVNDDDDDDDLPPCQENNHVLGIAKLHTGFQAFLPTHVLMYLGNLEVLRDDALAFSYKAAEDGVQWTTVVEDCVHDWFCVREVVKDKSILDRADRVFVDFVYRAVGTHDNAATRRYSQALHTVHEEEASGENDDTDDDDDDDVVNALGDISLSTSSSSGKRSKSSSLLYV
jgi:acetyl esterase/lipase